MARKRFKVKLRRMVTKVQTADIYVQAHTKAGARELALYDPGPLDDSGWTETEKTVTEPRVVEVQSD